MSIAPSKAPSTLFLFNHDVRFEPIDHLLKTGGLLKCVRRIQPKLVGVGDDKFYNFPANIVGASRGANQPCDRCSSCIFVNPLKYSFEMNPPWPRARTDSLRSIP